MWRAAAATTALVLTAAEDMGAATTALVEVLTGLIAEVTVQTGEDMAAVERTVTAATAAVVRAVTTAAELAAVELGTVVKGASLAAIVRGLVAVAVKGERWCSKGTACRL